MTTKNFVPRNNLEGQLGTKNKKWSKIYGDSTYVDNIYSNNSILTFNTLEEMKLSTELKEGYYCRTKGFYSPGDGGDAEYIVVNANYTSENENGYSIINSKEKIENTLIDTSYDSETNYKDIKIILNTSNFVNVKWFGAKLDGVTDDSDAFNRAVKYLVSIATKINNDINSRTLYVPNGIMKINKSIEIDTAYIGVYFDGTTIDATTITTDYAIKLYSSNRGHTPQHELYGMFIKGSNDKNKVCVLYEDARQFNMVKCEIYKFNKAIQFKNNCYIYSFYDCGFANCNICVENPDNLTNAGERIGFVSCTFANSTLAIKNDNPNGSIHLINCSIDYNIQAFDISNSSMIFCTDCHFEWSRYDSPHFVLRDESCTLKINGGYMVSRPEVDYEEIPKLNCIFDNLNCGSTGGVTLDNVHIHHMVSDYLFSGVNYQILNSKTYTPFTLPPLCEQDIDYSKFPNCLDTFIQKDNDSTDIYIDGTNIAVKRIDYNKEAQFHFFKKIDPKSSGFGNLILEFITNNAAGGAINVSLNMAYEKNDGTVQTVKQLDFYDIRNLVTEAGANNKVKAYHTWYIDNNLLLFGKNYNKNIYIYVNIILWGLNSDTIFKFNKINFEQY